MGFDFNQRGTDMTPLIEQAPAAPALPSARPSRVAAIVGQAKAKAPAEAQPAEQQQLDKEFVADMERAERQQAAG